ncbi:MAG: hypothetical protein ACQESH_05550 [Campylobacterota bacterium]
MTKTNEHIVFVNAKKNLNEDVAPLLQMLHRHFNSLKTLIENDHSLILRYIKKFKSRIDIIIIDHEVTRGVRVLDNILEIDPDFKILIISSSSHCSEIRGCEYCKEHYKKIRLMTPVDKKDVIDHIRHFDHYRCEFEKKCEQITEHSYLY